jgi:hypothetical protein
MDLFGRQRIAGKEVAMNNLDGWDWILLGAAAFVAVLTLSRLMLGHHALLLKRLRGELLQERLKKQQAERKKKKDTTAKGATRGTAA